MRKVLRILWLLMLRTVLTLIWGCLRLTELLLGRIAAWLQEVIKVYTKL
ncbi:MAG TPA: hypothetical protein VEY71_12140 [Chitinophagales bacterium]|nr:hypothetical protein [Chitinophagales bacterium]